LQKTEVTKLVGVNPDMITVECIILQHTPTHTTWTHNSVQLSSWTDLTAHGTDWTHATENCLRL